MDDQNPLNPLLGSIFPNAQITAVPSSEGGQLQAPIVPGVGGEGLKFTPPEQVQVPDIKVQEPVQEVRDVCTCGDPYCYTYRQARLQGMPPGGHADSWLRGERPERVSKQVQAADPEQLFVCPNCGQEDCITTIFGRMAQQARKQSR